MSDLKPSDDYKFQEAWDRVCQSFVISTGVDITKAPEYTVDEVLEQIRAKQEDNEERNAKYKVAKEVIGKTLDCINILGGIAAQGASMVFGPSALCFNAVSYLIQTGASFKWIFSSIADLFRRISDVLERCKIYLRMPPESVDISLGRIINDELLCFVDICSLSMKVLKRNKALITLKNFAFNSDEGVQGRLSQLADHVERESQMRATLGFGSLKKSKKVIAETREGTNKFNANVDKLLEFQQKKDAENAEKKQLQEIDTNLDGPSKVFEELQGKHRGFLNKKVEGSGQWLVIDPVYTEWANSGQSPLDVLCLSGEEGYGKSFLFATVIRDLYERYSQVTESVSFTSIAYYFFEQISLARGSSSAEKDISALVKALKVLAYQLASNDPVYRKDVASSTKTVDANQASQLWNILFEKSYRADSTFFLLFDGAEQMDREEVKQLLNILERLQTLSATWRKFRLRILFSTRKDTVDQIQNHLKHKFSIIDVASKNEDDIKLFINDRLSRMEILSSRSAEVVKLKQEILEGLVKEAHGDYINIGLLLNGIIDKKRTGESRDIVSRSGEKRSDTIARKIQELNQTLGEDNISDLNELLVWVMNAPRRLQLHELEAVLFLKNGKPSLRPLADEIKDKYSALFHIQGELDPKTNTMDLRAKVELVSDSIEEYFRVTASNEEMTSSREWNTIGDGTESEVRIVQRFLDLICDSKLYKKFDFESFFERKLSKKSLRLSVDPDTAHLKILTTCLRAIIEKSDETAGLLQYATDLFACHLQATDLSLIHPQSKAMVGSLLVKLFTDEEAIRNWWTEPNLIYRYSWIYNDDSSETVLEWLQDSAVTRKLSEDEIKWVKSLSSKSEPDADLLEHVAKFMVHQWLQAVDWTISYVFFSVNAYLNKIENRRKPGVKRLTRDSRGEFPASRIYQVAEWAREQLGVKSLNYEETRNLARTLKETGNYDDAVETFKLAMSLEPDNWYAQWGLSETYMQQKKYDPALEILQKVRALIESGEAKNSGPADALDSVIRDIAVANRESGNSEIAWEIYESMLKKNPDDYEAAFDMISALHAKGNYTRILEFLERLKKSIEETSGHDRRTRLFHVYFWNEDYHDTLAAAASDPGGITAIKDSYQAAIDAADKNLHNGKDQSGVYEGELKDIMAYLLHYYAKLLYNNNTSTEEKEIAYSMWVRIVQFEDNKGWYLYRAQIYAIQHLATLYYQEARLAGIGTELATKYIDDLEQITISGLGNPAKWAKEQFPKQILARYYALTGETEKVKNTLRPLVKANLDLLSDDDHNDWQPLDGLSLHFMYSGQDENCLAAWSLIKPDYVEEEREEDENATQATDVPEATSPEKAEKRLEGPLRYVCDGMCGKEWSYPDDIYFCRDCHEVMFDEGCLKKLRDGTLKVRNCQKTHEMLHAPKYDAEELEKVGKGNVKVGQEITRVEDWIQSIKQDWGISME